MQSLYHYCKYLAFGLLLLLTLLLAVTTGVEHVWGTEWVMRHVYHAPWFAVLWGIMALSGGGWLMGAKHLRGKGERWRMGVLHGAWILILVGAGVSALTSRSGRIHLRPNVTEQAYVPEGEDHRLVRLPFRICLQEFHVRHHAGTDEAQDYTSHVTIDGQPYTIGMNRVVTVEGYRLFQYAYDADGQGSVLLVRYDPWGRPLTYAGYLLLLIGMGLTLFAPAGGMRRNYRALRRLSMVAMAFVWSTAALLANDEKVGAKENAPSLIASTDTAVGNVSPSSLSLPYLSRETATEIGTLYTAFGGRICPVQTVAQDFCRKLQGRTQYEGFTAEQVLTGFLLWPEAWEQVPFIRLKSRALRRALSVESSTSYRALVIALQQTDAETLPMPNEATAMVHLIESVKEGEWLRMLPVQEADNAKGGIQWEACPQLWDATLSTDSLLAHLRQLKAYQLERGGDTLPSEGLIRAERLYNQVDLPYWLSRWVLALGVVCMLVALRSRRYPRWAIVTTLTTEAVGLFGLTLYLGLRSFISGRIPLGNGYETLLTAAWFSMLIGMLWSYRLRRAPLLPAIPLLASGFFLLVASLTRSGAEVSQLVPVLDSPWLQLHVSLVMWAYSLLTFTFLHSLCSLLRTPLDHRSVFQSRLLLYPALALLTAGIFTGAVWADFSWGRYWGWDPKEVWALVTLFVYSLPLHSASLPRFRSPRFYHIYLLIAFTTVLMTYFGVNYWLGGLHAYVG